jgi:hypothetical protein
LETPISFNTRFIHVESGDYPLTFASIKSRHPLTSFAADPSAEQLKELGYHVVTEILAPVGDVVLEGVPELQEDGSYKQTYTVRAFNEDEIKQRLSMKQIDLENQITVLKNAALVKGAPFNFGGDFGVQHVQMRDGDRANIIGLRFKADAIVAAGADTMMGVRTGENNLVPVTAAQFLDLSWKFMSAFEAVMGTAWHYEDLVKAADAAEDLPELPADFTPEVQSLVAA